MPTTPQHTPTPWALNRNRVYIETGDGITVAVVSSNFSDEANAANAALIVRAVNAYEPMREALRDLLNYAEANVPPKRLQPRIQAARAVLALAEKE